MVASVIAVSYYDTTYLRDDAVEDEFRMRIEPSLAAIQSADCDQSQTTYILTLEPLIIQMYGGTHVDVVSLPELDGTVIQEIGFSAGMTNLLYLDEQIHRTPEDSERYCDKMAILNRLQRRTLFYDSTFSIVEISVTPPEHAPSVDNCVAEAVGR